MASYYSTREGRHIELEQKAGTLSVSLHICLASRFSASQQRSEKLHHKRVFFAILRAANET